MLKPSTNRLDYGKLLAPPAGYTLDKAVGTTYSLDFDTLIGICLALGISAEIDSTLLNDPLYLLNTLKLAGDKIAIFCQAGQIHLPPRITPLYILLEKVVFQVQLKGRAFGQRHSFHPKVWLIKYVHPTGEPIFRLIVLSRNLTFDRSWDVAVSLDGAGQGKHNEKNEPLMDFLSFLHDYIESSTANGRMKRSMMRELMRELSSVEFVIDHEAFTDFEFIPVGVKKIDGGKYSLADTHLYTSPFHELLIMSPFLSSSVISGFNRRSDHYKNTKCMLFTRKEALSDLKPVHCDKFQLYTLKEQVVDGESFLSEDEGEFLKQDIHAKMYLAQRYGKWVELYLGSMNATHSAANGNIEGVLRLFSINRCLNVGKLSKNLFGGEEDDPANPFERTNLPESVSVEEELSDILEREIRKALVYPNRAVIEKTEDSYRSTVTFDKGVERVQLQLSPLLAFEDKPLEETVIFEDLNLLQLSEFYIISARREDTIVRRVIKIPTDNMPNNREQSVVTDVIKDTNVFFQYLAFILGENHLMSALENYVVKNDKIDHSRTQHAFPALYEKLLRTAVRSPEKLDEISYVIEMVRDEGIIPEGFEELYAAFRKAVGLK
jgi:hypothetical protein